VANIKKNSFLEWQTLEAPPHERGTDWFISVAIVAFAVAVASVILGNYMFAVLIVVGAAALLLHVARVPKRIAVQIFEKGVMMGSMLYPYETLRSFFVNETEGRLFIRTNKLFVPILVLLIEDTDPKDIRLTLSKYLPEEEIEESFWEKLMEHIGF